MSAKSWSYRWNHQHRQYPTSRRGVCQGISVQHILGIQDIQYPRVVCIWWVQKVDHLGKILHIPDIQHLGEVYVTESVFNISWWNPSYPLYPISNILDRCISGNLRSTNPWYPRFPISNGGVYLMIAKRWSYQWNPQYPTSRRCECPGICVQHILGIHDIQYLWVVCIWCSQIVHHLGEILHMPDIQHPGEVNVRESAFNISLVSKISNIYGWGVFDAHK